MTDNANRIRFFVSSTFEDMHDERDAIQMRVLPSVSRIAESHGYNIDFCDLRWGINTQDCNESDKSDKVLKVCFDEIKKCRPYMIVMLGERYGSVPDEEAFVSVLLHINNRGSEICFSKDDIYGKSYTELEILYGPLSDEEILKRTLFLFREPIEGAPAHFQSKNDESKEKMALLKSLIRQKLKEKFGNDDQIVTYSLSWEGGEHGGHVNGIPEFSEILKDKLMKMITPSFHMWENYSDTQKKLRIQKAYAQKTALDFCAVKQLARCEEKMKKGIHTLYIYGTQENGCRSLSAKLALSCEEKGYLIFPIFKDADRSFSSVEDVKSFWRDCVREYLRENGACNISDDMELEELLEIYFSDHSRPHLILMTDLYSELFAECSINLKKHHRFLLIFVLESTRCFCKEETDDDRIVSTECDEPGANEILDAILKGLGKELPFVIRSLILEKHGHQSYGYISKLVKRLIMIDGGDLREAAEEAKNLSLKGDEALFWLQKKLVEELPDTNEALSQYLWEEANQRLGREFVTGILRYTALFDKGLRQKDLLGLLQAEGIHWDGAAYSVLIHYFSEMITETTYGYTIHTNHFGRKEYCKTFDTKDYYRKFLDYIRSGKISYEDELFTRYLIEVCSLLEEKEFFLSVCEGDYGEEAAKTIAGKVLSDYHHFDWVYKTFEEKSTPYTEKDVVFLNRYIYEKYESGKHNRQKREKISELSVSVAKKIQIENSKLIDVYIKRARLSNNKKEFYQYMCMAEELLKKEDDARIDYERLGNLYLEIAEEYVAAKDIMEYFLIARDALRKCLQKKERILSYIWIDVYKARFLYRLSEVVREYNERYKELYEEANDREMDLLRGKYKNPHQFFYDCDRGFPPSVLESMEAGVAEAMKEYELDGSPLDELRENLLREAMENFALAENYMWKCGDWIWKLAEQLIFYADRESIPEEIRLAVCEKVLLLLQDAGNTDRDLYSETCLRYVNLLLKHDVARAKECIENMLNVYRDSELKAESNYSKLNIIFSICEMMTENGYHEEAYDISLRLIDVLLAREINEMDERYRIRERLLHVYRLAQKTAFKTEKYLQAWNFSDILAERLILFYTESWYYGEHETWEFFRELKSALCRELPIIFSKIQTYQLERLGHAVNKLGLICNHAQSDYIMLVAKSAKICMGIGEYSELILKKLDKREWKSAWGNDEDLFEKWNAVASYVEIAIECGISVKKELPLLLAYLPRLKRDCGSKYPACLIKYKKLLKSEKGEF